MPTKVLISNLVSGIPYPSSNQTADAQIRIDITASVANARVYLRVIDPADTAAYVQPVSCGSSSGCDCGIAGQMCDNKDAYNNFGFGSGSPYAKTAYVDMVSGQGSIILHTTAQYAGDNYQVQASYQSLSATTPVTNAHIKAQSGIITAWKRVFVERDRMFRKGGLLFADFNKDTCSPNCNKILLYDWATVADGDSIVVFDEAATAEVGGEVRTVQGVPVPGPPNSGYETVTLNANLTKNYYATSNNASSPPVPTFSTGHSGGVGVLSGDPEVINGSGARFYDVDIGAVPQAYNDAFVEFVAPRSGQGALPFIDGIRTSIGDWGIEEKLSQIWFLNKNRNGSNPDINDPHNYFHLIGAGTDADDSFGFTQSDADSSFLMVGWLEATYAGYPMPALVQHSVCHELGHQFDINPCTDPQFHDNNKAWCGADASAPCSDTTSGYEPCVMYVSATWLDPVYTVLISNGKIRFCCSNLLGTATTPPCSNAACVGEVGIRGATDPH